MTDRDQAGGSLPNACPFLALDEDRDRRSAVPDGRHRCYAESTPVPRALTYQESFCLSAAFPSCRSFLEWAARAAAEPVHGAARGPGAGATPLPPIPDAPPTPLGPPPAAPVGAPAVVAPFASVAPPPSAMPTGPSAPPTGSVPLAPVASGSSGSLPPASARDAWPPAPAAPGHTPAWQPPGAARQDPPPYPWATPPPWVAEPELRSTATLPSSARPPLDPERPDWGTTQSADPWLEEEAPATGAWPPVAPPGPSQLTGTFAARRGVEWIDPTAAPAAGPASMPPLGGAPAWPPAPPSAAAASATGLGASPPPPRATPPSAAAPSPVGSSSSATHTANAAVAGATSAGPGLPPVSVAPAQYPAAPAPMASLTASPAAVPGPVTWPAVAEDPDAWPARPEGPATWPGAPVAIPVGAGPGRVPSAWPPASDPGWPEAPPPSVDAPPSGPVPPPTQQSPGGGAPSASTDPAPSPPGRRQPSSRWLPSFLGGQPAPADAAGAAVVARTGPAAGLAAEDPGFAADGTEAWSTAGADGGTDAADTWSEAGATVPWPPVMDHGPDGDAAALGEPDPWAVDETGSIDVAPAEASIASDDPPGALAPRRRRRPGVPVDTNAPASVGAQTSAAARAKESGEWNRSRRQGVKTGVRRIIPGVIPPVALGAVVLFLAAAALFVVPGLFAGGGTPTPAPTLATGAPAVVDASGRPVATPTPAPSKPPTAAFVTYTVKSGDTLGAISRRFSVTQDQLVCVNRELRRNPNLLTIGQQLQIPPKSYVCPTPAKTKKP